MNILTLSRLGKNFISRHFKIEFLFIFFFQKIGIDISCKLSQFAENVKAYFPEKIRKIS